MLTQLSKELHSQGGVDEEEQHEEEAQVAHLWREMGGAGGQRPRGIHEEKGESCGGHRVGRRSPRPGEGQGSGSLEQEGRGEGPQARGTEAGPDSGQL